MPARHLAGAQMQMGSSRTRAARATDAAEHRPPSHGLLAPYHGPAEVLVGRHEPAAANAHRESSSGNAAGERNAAAARSAHRRADRRAEIHSAMLPAREPVGADVERAQDRTVDRPPPGAPVRRRRGDQDYQDHKHENRHGGDGTTEPPQPTAER